MAIWPRVPAVMAAAMPAAAAASSPPMVVTIKGRAWEIQRELEKAKVHPVWTEVNRTGKVTTAWCGGHGGRPWQKRKSRGEVIVSFG